MNEIGKMSILDGWPKGKSANIVAEFGFPSIERATFLVVAEGVPDGCLSIVDFIKGQAILCLEVLE